MNAAPLSAPLDVPSRPAPGLPEVLARLDRLTDWERRPRGGMRVGLAPMHDLLARLGARNAGCGWSMSAAPRARARSAP